MTRTHTVIALLIFALMVIINGCATTPVYAKPYADPQEQLQDRIECQTEAEKGSWTIFPGYNNKWLEHRLLSECYQRRGWTRQN
jgi:hypothetical protein